MPAQVPDMLRNNSVSPSHSALTRPPAICSVRLDGIGFTTPARARSALLWASTGTKDPSASDILYVKALAAPFTVNTMPEGTLKALAKHNQLGSILPADGGDCEQVLTQFADAGVDIDAVAVRLQEEGAKSFVKSWNDLMDVIASKTALLQKAS